MQTNLIDDIIDLLPIVAKNRTWVVTRWGWIRSQEDDACPICALVNEIRGADYWNVAAYSAMKSVGFDVNGMEPLECFLNAADLSKPRDPQVRRIRARILEALGL